MQLTTGDKQIAQFIIMLRGEKVILDFHVSALYEVETRSLKQQVRRNIDRFPSDFMFELAEHEIELLVSQNVIPHRGILGGAKPLAFTEQGVAMLSSVLRSQKAMDVNIAIIRTFVHLRRMLEDNKELSLAVKKLEKKYNEKFQVIFDAIQNLIAQKSKPRKMIGYKKESE